MKEEKNLLNIFLTVSSGLISKKTLQSMDPYYLHNFEIHMIDNVFMKVLPGGWWAELLWSVDSVLQSVLSEVSGQTDIWI